jgi:hypothetical protein
MLCKRKKRLFSSSLGVWLSSLSASLYAVAKTSEKEWEYHYLPTYLPTSLAYLHVAESPFRSYISTPSQEIPSILGNPKILYRVYTSPPLVPILSHTNPVHALPSSFLKAYFTIILPPTQRSSRESISVSFPHDSHYAPHPNECHMPRPSHACWIDHPNNIWWGAKIVTSLIM